MQCTGSMAVRVVRVKRQRDVRSESVEDYAVVRFRHLFVHYKTNNDAQSRYTRTFFYASRSLYREVVVVLRGQESFGDPTTLILSLTRFFCVLVLSLVSFPKISLRVLHYPLYPPPVTGILTPKLLGVLACGPFLRLTKWLSKMQDPSRRYWKPRCSKRSMLIKTNPNTNLKTSTVWLFHNLPMRHRQTPYSHCGKCRL